MFRPQWRIPLPLPSPELGRAFVAPVTVHSSHCHSPCLPGEPPLSVHVLPHLQPPRTSIVGQFSKQVWGRGG